MTPFKVPDGPFTIEQIMAAIREQVVRPGDDSNAVATLPPETLAAPPASIAAPIPSSILVSPDNGDEPLRESLARLARRQDTRPEYRIRSHRPLLRALIDPVKKLIHWGARPYTDQIREKQEAWNAETLEAFRRLLARLNAIDQRFARADKSLARVDERCARIEARALRLEKLDSTGDFYAQADPSKKLAAMDASRGRYDDIHLRQKQYIDYFRGLPGQALDIGCGRGELLNMLRGEGIECWGADVDPMMVRAAGAAGVHVVQADALTALRSLEPGKLGGLFAAQVVEHLHPGELLELLQLAHNRIAPGGVIVLETLNPASLGVLAKSYYRDLDHKQPIHPEHLKQVVQLAGFERVELHYLHPFGEEELPPALPSAAELGIPKEAHAALARRFETIDALLFGMQDYYIVARQPLNSDKASSGAAGGA